MLQDAGVDAELVHIGDNNDDHREVVRFGATHVVIEALWVVPDKFDELAQACPGVHFTLRNHSETPFLTGGGDRLRLDAPLSRPPNVAMSCNAPGCRARPLPGAHQAPELERA